MADRNQLKVADRHGIADDDPFAELTRIMGFDPREPVRPQTPAPAEAADDAFDIDLEKELMGELAGFDDEPAVAAPVVTEQPSLETQASQAEWTPADADEVESVAEPDFDLDAAMDEQVVASLEEDFVAGDVEQAAAGDELYAEPEAVEAEQGAPRPEADEADEYVPVAGLEDAAAEDAYGGAGAQPVEAAGDEAYVAASKAEAASVKGTSDDDFVAYFDGAMADVDMDFADVSSMPEARGEIVEETASADDAFELDPVAFADFDDEAGGAVEEPVFGQVEQDAISRADETDGPMAGEVAVQDVDFDGAFDEAFAVEEPQAAAVELPQQPAAHDNTLEDELNALLSRMTARPAVSEPAIVAATAAAAEPVEPVADHASADGEGNAGEDLDAALLADLQALDLGDIGAGHEDAEPAQESRPAAESSWSWGRGTPFAQPATPVSAMEPQPSQQAAAGPDWNEMAQQPYDYGAQAAAVSAAPATPPRADMPEVETVDVPERVVALADDLDLPELSFEQDRPEPIPYGDLDAEFSGLMGNVAEAPASSAPTYEDDPYMGFPQGQGAAPAYAAATASAGGVAAAFGPAGFAQGGQRPGHEAPGAGELDYDPDLDEANTVPELDEAAGRPRNRALLAAAVIGAVAVVGGIGAFALSPGGSGSDAPAIVKADNQPIKVKPENPGGTVIPNQDNKVYEAVNGVKAADPKQQKLVTDAQEPMDVKQAVNEQPESRVVDLSPQDGAGATAAAPKSEDRIEQVSAPKEDAGNQETALVTPRKVRTMIVKPDGSLVPREEQAPAKVAATEPADPAPQHVEASSDQTGAVSAAAENGSAASGGARAQSSNTPNAVPVAPQRPSDQPVDVVGEVKPDQVAALDQGTAAAGSWSMQIASQPTAESAQASYKNLARRYASVLDGHSANIVKAEIAGKGTFYRVRIPTQSRNDAIKLCESYKAAGGNCFVSK